MRLAAIAFFLSTSGCSYVGERFRDFGDIWRLEGSFGLGIQAHASAGEFAHVGVGSSRRHIAGFRYGTAGSRFVIEDHLPLSFVWTLADTDHPHLHRILVEEKNPGNHRCYVLFPGELNHDDWELRAVQYFNLEAGFHALLLGFEFGFSLGEFFDWIVGWFKLSDRWSWMDLGKDDLPAQRENRELYERRDRRVGSPLHP